MATRIAPPGFVGLDPVKPIRKYTRHLPHWRQAGASYFVTFRQHDSLPQSKLDELAAFRQEWLEKSGRIGNPSYEGSCRTDFQSVQDEDEELAREVMQRIERWLDQGMGTCRLKKPECAKLIVDAMHHFDNQRYELDCYIVMPNHVHVALRPFDDDDDALEKILQSWKRHSAQAINRRLRLSGTFWQEESFDQIIRDNDHLNRVIQYIGANAKRAGLNAGEFARWIWPEWVKLGWGFDDECRTD